MLISIITPTRNRASTYLPDLINSINLQIIPDKWSIEHIICDDASDSDELQKLNQIIQNTRHKTAIVSHSSQKGVAAARNTALKLSAGDFIVDVDDDDLLPANSIVNRIMHLISSDAKWSFGNAIVVNESLQIIPGKELYMNWDHSALSNYDVISAVMGGAAWFWAGTRTYTREALITNNKWRLWDESFPVAEDLEHWLMLLNTVGKPAHNPNYVVYWRQKNQSLGINSLKDGTMLYYQEKAYEKWARVN